MKPPKTAKKIFSTSKEATGEKQLYSVFYKIPCIDCDKKYLGQTIFRGKNQTAYIRYDKKYQQRKALICHVFSEGHVLNFEGVENNHYKRNISEMI